MIPLKTQLEQKITNRMSRFKKYLLLLISPFLFCCNNIDETINDNILTTYYNTGEKECEFQINEFGEKDGESICFYKSGLKKKITHWRKDSIPINEQYVFFSSGNLKEYHFYNFIGEKRYSRFYNENGDLLNEIGDFLSHEIISSPKVSLGDSIVIDIYIASPPDCKFEVFGIDSEGRYSLNNKSDSRFIYTSIIEPSSRGNYVFVYEIDFIDTISTRIETRKSDVSFIVE